jgi:hypothetical protein
VACIARGLCFAVGRIPWAGDEPAKRQITIQDNTNTEENYKTVEDNTLDPAATVLDIKSPMRSKTPLKPVNSQWVERLEKGGGAYSQKGHSIQTDSEPTATAYQE